MIPEPTGIFIVCLSWTREELTVNVYPQLSHSESPNVCNLSVSETSLFSSLSTKLSHEDGLETCA